MVHEYLIELPEATLAEKVRYYLSYFGLEATASHSLAVAEEARRLAPQFNLDAEQAFVAGLLHDIGGAILENERVSLAQKYGLSIQEAEKELPLLLHQTFSAILAQEEFGITDPVILSAVACHTTLKAGASPFDKLIFIADKLKWDRAHRAPYLTELEAAIELSLDQACYCYLNWAFTTGMPVIHPDTQAAFDELKAQEKGRMQ